MADSVEVANLYATIGAETSGFMSGISGIMNSIPGVTQAILGLGIAGVSIGMIGKYSLDAASDTQQANTMFSQALGNIGIEYSSVKEQADQFIQKLQQQTGYQDDDLTRSLTSLIQITGNYSVAQKDLALATDIARGKNIDLAQASMIVGRVTEGNFTMLTRMGIQLDKNATATEALAELTRRFGGDGAAYMDTFAGSQAKVSTALHDLSVKFGAELMPYAQKANEVFVEMIGIASRLLDSWNRMTPSTRGFVEAIGAVAAGIAIAGPVWAGLTAIARGFLSIVTGTTGQIILLVGAVAGIAVVAQFVGENWSKMGDLFLEVFDSMLSTALDWASKVSGIFARLFSGTSVGNAFQQMTQSFETSSQKMSDASDKVAQNANGNWMSITQIAQNDMASIGTYWDQLSAKMKVQIASTKDYTKQNVDQMAQFFQGLGDVANSVGSTMVTTFSSDVMSMTDVFGNGTQTMAAAFNKMIDQMLEKIVESGILNLVGLLFGGSSVGFGILGNIFGVGKAGVPGAAAGGIVDGPTLMVAGEAGPEAIIPLSQLSSVASNSGVAGNQSSAGSSLSIGNITLPSMVNMMDQQTLRNTVKQVFDTAKSMGLIA